MAVNVCQADVFAFSGLLLRKKSETVPARKIFIQATEIDSLLPRKMRRLESELLNVKNENTALFEIGSKLSPLN